MSRIELNLDETPEDAGMIRITRYGVEMVEFLVHCHRESAHEAQCNGFPAWCYTMHVDAGYKYSKAIGYMLRNNLPFITQDALLKFNDMEPTPLAAATGLEQAEAAIQARPKSLAGKIAGWIWGRKK